MENCTEIDTAYSNTNKCCDTCEVAGGLACEEYYSWREVEKWTKKLLDAESLKKRTAVTVFGMPRLVRPPFNEHCIVSRYYGPAKIVPSIYRAEEMFPSSEGIPRL